MLALMKQAGLEVDVLTLQGGDVWPQGLANRLYRTTRLPFTRHLPPYGSGLRRGWATALLTLTAIRLQLTHSYDAIHCADRAIRAAAFVARLFGTRFLFEWNTESGHDLIRWLKRRSARFRHTANLVFSDVPYPLSRLREVGFCGRVATLAALPAPCIQRLPLPSVRLRGETQPFHVTALAFTPHFTDLNALLEALPNLLSLPNLHLTLAGGTPDAAEKLRTRLTKRFPPSGAWDVRPAPEGPLECMAYLTAADLVFLPAVHGALPPPILLDAMAAQRALLATQCPAYETLLTPQNAMLIHGGAAAIETAIRRHMLSPLLCAEHAEAAAETISRERNASALAAVLRSCYALALTSPRV